MEKRFIKSFVAIGAVILLMMAFTSCSKETNQKATIKGLVVEKPVHQPYSIQDMMASMMGPGGMPSEAGRDSRQHRRFTDRRA